MSHEDREQTSHVLASPLAMQSAAWAAFEPGDDICPPWWPRRWPPRGPLAGHDLPIDVLAVDRVYTALTLLASTFQYSDAAMIKEVRALAHTHVREGAEVLARGASVAWEPGDDICPPPRRWPWPGPRPWLFSAGLDGPRPHPWRVIPTKAAPLLETLGLLHAYDVAAKIGDGPARLAATAAIGAALVAHTQRLG